VLAFSTLYRPVKELPCGCSSLTAGGGRTLPASQRRRFVFFHSFIMAKAKNTSSETEELRRKIEELRSALDWLYFEWRGKTLETPPCWQELVDTVEAALDYSEDE
jgi:hypothetical protein